jgi:hypothetical protein
MGTAVCRPGSALYNRILSRLSALRANAYAYRLDHTKIQTGQAHLRNLLYSIKRFETTPICLQ